MESNKKDELDHIGAWAEENNLILNKSKTKEMIFIKGRSSQLPPTTEDIQRVSSMKKLGVTLQNNLSMKDHVDAVLAKCSNMIYALNILKHHGMRQQGLEQVFHSKVISRITYASPAWYGMAGQEELNRINAFLRRSKRSGFYPEDGKTFQELCKISDERLFRRILSNTSHVLYKFLPEKKLTKYELRKRKHDFNLPIKDDRNFINRILLADI